MSLVIGFSTVAALATNYNANQSKEVVITKPFTVVRIDLRHGEAILSTENQNLVFVYFNSTTSNGELSIDNLTDIVVMNKTGDELSFYIGRDDVSEIVSTLENGQSLYASAKGDRQ
ncbi:hypothetical protein [Acinetobacter sp. ANC 5502]